MRLIDADALLKGIAELKQSPWYENYSGRFFRKEAVEIIEDLCIKKEPTVDAVEVVRCKDCKFSPFWFGGNNWKLCPLVDDFVKEQTRDDYCSYGRRREE